MDKDELRLGKHLAQDVDARGVHGRLQQQPLALPPRGVLRLSQEIQKRLLPPRDLRARRAVPHAVPPPKQRLAFGKHQRHVRRRAAAELIRRHLVLLRGVVR
eukprot:30706-Pelagococcus_subviridis.AAC.15